MKKRFIITEEAEKDYFAIWEYIAADSVDMADKFIDLLHLTHHTLLLFPEIGRLRKESGKVVRVFSAKNYLFVYWEREDTVELLRVIHGARDLPAVLENF